MDVVIKKFKENKRAWMKLVEMAIALLLITGILVIMLEKNQVKTENNYAKIYNKEINILREIELNETLRESILNTTQQPPIKWEDFETQGLEQVKSKIEKETPDYLKCKGRICYMNESCYTSIKKQKDIYVQSIAITSTKDTQDFRQLKLFCWIR